MAINEFLPFGTGPGANVITQVQYEQLARRLLGFSSGIALSAELNKAWRQSSVLTHALGQVMADRTGQDIRDDGDLQALQAQLEYALFHNVAPADVLQAHLQDQNNPHNVTIGQIGAASAAALTSHVQNTNNPHNVTLGQLGGASAAALNAHVADTNNPHQVTLGQLGGASAAALQAHVSDTNNPHQVTLAQLGGAPNHSPTLTGIPAAPTPPWYSSSDIIATTAFTHAAIQAALTNGDGFTQSFSGIGWCRFPNGLIRQWGEYTAAMVSNQSPTVTFPIAFPNACLNASAIVRNADGSDARDTNMQVRELASTHFIAYVNHTPVGGGINGITGFFWEAIGH